ncbi:hypothetical protein [Desulfotomaculum sp. 1211_IL3151]|uniref:hypothetical protein n=1 Tax=Desulfotomaculum sp. 1211_IL3151 TaxID=3084055 RepID=UPI002FDB6BD3
MKGNIDDIWDAIEEVVEKRLENLLEETTDGEENEPVKDLLPEEEIQPNDLDELDELMEKEPKQEHSSREYSDELNYWMREFESMLKDYDPSPKTKAEFKKSCKSNKGISPLLLGCGGVFLLGLLTSAAVLIKIKRSNRQLCALPVQQEPEVAKIVIEEPPPEVKNVQNTEKRPFIRLPGLFPQY